jgi:biotin carboxyl carrier protein
VLRVACAKGAEVKPGDRLVVIEAMKMQNPIFCEYHGTVSDVSVEEGQAVNTGDALVHVDEIE